MKEYELDKSTGELIWTEDNSKVLELKKMLKNSHLERYVEQLKNDGFKKVKALDYSPEFIYWYERIYLQSPRMCSLEYDDEKMWEAWKAAKEYGIKEL
jgi:hypothetical protein